VGGAVWRGRLRVEGAEGPSESVGGRGRTSKAMQAGGSGGLAKGGGSWGTSASSSGVNDFASSSADIPWD